VRRAFALLVVSAVLAVAPAASAASSHDLAEGRRHLHRANALAADAKCDAAVREYTFAYQKLHDPVVLFNRAECYRRLGQNDAAVSDYRAFLEAVPRAPNRADVEARLAALEGVPPPSLTPAPARPPAPAAVSPAPAQALAPAVSPPVTPALPPPDVSAPATPMVSAAPASSPASPEPAVESASHDRLWLWAAIGAAVAGGAVGAYAALRAPSASPPSTQLGNYKF